MRKVCVCGHFGGRKIFCDGQTVKTKTITGELKRQLGSDEVMTLDTYGGKRSLPKIVASVPAGLRTCANFIMMPAQNGLRVLTPLLLFWNRFYKRKLHYIVIGGWLPSYLQDKEFLTRGLREFDCIYVETLSMKKDLELMGFSNVVVMPNCKKLRILDSEELEYTIVEPLRLCTFSRVMQEKGIEDAVKVVSEINAALGRTVYTLDIFGPVDSNQIEWFEALKKSFGDTVEYKGITSPEKTPEVLKAYFSLLFPTRFKTEGIPGSIIDAYAAGIPVICSDWENRQDILDDGVTGRVYEFGDIDGLRALLEEIAKDPASLVKLKPVCLEQARRYRPESVVGEILIGGLL